MNTLYSFLLVLVIAAAAQAFAPAATSARASTGLSAFEGRKLTAAENAYARGGKPSWVFEAETMYVEEPAPKKAKTVAKKAVKKTAAAAAPAKKAAFSFSFGKK